MCRDFLRNVCLRGRRCRYRHPGSVEALQLSRSSELTFCHDFQNAGCRRPSCRFVHCTRDEEERFRRGGALPARLQQAAVTLVAPSAAAAVAAAAAAAVVVAPPPDTAPVCKDHLKGECRRGVRCKFRHLAPPQLPAGVVAAIAVADATTAAAAAAAAVQAAQLDPFDEYARCYDIDPPKRRRMDDAFAAVAAVDYHLDDEKTSMRRKLDELRKQVSDLAATNEVLLEQNARFRAVKCPVPIVTVSGIVTPAVQAMPVSLAPVINLAPQPLEVAAAAAAALPPLLDAVGGVVSTAILSYPVVSHVQLPSTLG